MILLLQVSLPYGISAQENFERSGAVKCAELTEKYKYYWKMENNALESVDEDGYERNTLTQISGSIANGVLKNIRYTLEREILLTHDSPWVIQWRSVGNWSGMLLSSTAQSPSDGLSYLFRDPGSKIFAFGEYNGAWNNYGMVLDLDMTVSHLFQLENRIAEDGSNGVVLLVDGKEVGPMERYFVTSKDQNCLVNWANGRDLVFSFIGTSSHAMNGMAPEYLRVWEGGHDHSYSVMVTEPTENRQGYTTYTCRECGYSYVDHFTDPICQHIWDPWKELAPPTCSKEGTDLRTCTLCGLEQYRDTRISGDHGRILVSDPLSDGYFTGKTILQIGDSITYGVNTTKTYGAYLSEALGATVINKGVSGSGYCSGGRMTTNKTLTEANVRAADLVTVMLGVNDWAWAVKEGSWNGNPNYYDKSETYYQLGDFDSEDPSTFYGALHGWCREILRLKQLSGFENKEFVVITPLITSWNNSVGQRVWDQDKKNIHGHTFREYCTAILEVCAYYDIPVFDANMFSGIYYRGPEDTNVGETGGDGVHVNANGHGLLAQALEEFLLEGYSYEDRGVLHGGHSYENGICKDCRLPYKNTDSEEEEPVTETAWKLQHTLDLASDISVNFAIEKSLLTGFDPDTVHVVVEQDVYEGNEKIGCKTTVLLPVERGNYYYFTLQGLTAIHMNDRLRGVLYGIKDGVEYCSEVDDYSIADYAYSQMDRPVSHSLKVLCAELLRYGAKAQIYKAYRRDHLADAQMTEEQQAYLTDGDSVAFGNTNEILNDLPNALVRWQGKALNLESKVCLKFIFSPGTYSGEAGELSLRVNYTDIYGTEKQFTLDNAQLYNSRLNYYAFTLDALLAAELRSVVSVQIYAGEIPVSCTLQYSADTYGNNKTGDLLELCKALFAYSDSAKAYFVG